MLSCIFFLRWITASTFGRVVNVNADHSGWAVEDMNCLCSLGHLDRGFESHSRYGCLCVCLFCICVVLCVGCGLVTG
jgi:hypothetical protein